MKTITPAKASEILKGGEAVLIDIRTSREYGQGHIEGAELVDFYEDFRDKIDKYDRDKRYIIYCRTASRTHYAMMIMRQMGFSDVSHIQGGTVEWERQGYPLVQ